MFILQKYFRCSTTSGWMNRAFLMQTNRVPVQQSSSLFFHSYKVQNQLINLNLCLSLSEQFVICKYTITNCRHKYVYKHDSHRCFSIKKINHSFLAMFSIYIHLAETVYEKKNPSAKNALVIRILLNVFLFSLLLMFFQNI